MNKLELLAPAGSMESLVAAINKGADAIYLGGSKFSARAYASNFDNEKMEEAVDYAHTYGVKVYVTLNTLIKENEFNEAVDYVSFLYKIGVDALIIQDTGLIKAIKERHENFELHASTQLTIHNGEGAIFFNENGLHRIVLSRELSLDEIKYISKDLNIETEIFVHGALCVCYSGQCLMSSLIGGRSGNRGRCAQSCRLPYTLVRDNDNRETKGYLLSPKDICTVDNVEDLIASGTSSLKVEGRMKRPEYVAGVIGEYKKVIDRAYKNKANNNNDSKKTLMKLFNREGFSTAYLYKNVGKDMMAFKNPKNTGILMGEVISNGEVLLKEDIALKDGVRVNDDGFIISKILLNNKEVQEAKAGDKVKLFPKKYKSKDKLYKTSDVKLLDKLKVAYENPYERKINLDAKVRFKVGEPIEISIDFNDKSYKKQGELVQEAINKPLSKERLEDNLKKSGQITYEIENVDFLEFENGFMPMSSINNLRREILEEIKSYETLKYKRYDKASTKTTKQPVKEEKLPELMISVQTKDQLKACMDLGVTNIIVDIFGKNTDDLNKNSLNNLRKTNANVYIKAPTIIKEEFKTVCNIIESNLNCIKGIVTANCGIINKFKDKTNIIGDYKLNIFNSKSLEFYNNYLLGSMISIELNRKEIKKLLSKYKNGSQYLVYGKPEVMVSEYCMIGSTFGNKSTKKSCDGQCINNTFRLRDRMNEEFVIKTDIFCRSHIYNTVPMNLTKEMSELKEFGIESFRVDLTSEDYDASYDIINSILNNEKVEVIKTTKGHYKRGVE